ncbi:MAG: iron-containing alcohol dehydrogenase [Planctomycetes bacterium]|nr:iron-containing alcohol dehydrogenase [Planctomycetota bacterium]
MTLHFFSFPTPIVFGAGARAQVADHLKANGCTRPLVVTDRGLAALPVFADFVAKLTPTVDAAVFSGVFGNPVASQVAAGVAAYRAHRADSIIGFGGGAALDVAKAVALMSGHPGEILDYEDGKPGALPIDRAIPYWVALPTTAGTGSEVGRSAVVSDETTHVKRIVFSPRLLARAVFADPELTLALPAGVTAATGMDALTHCVEAYLAKDWHPICDGIALEGVRLAARNLATCVKRPSDVPARGAMLMASMMGAIAFQKGLGVTHSCAHALSAAADMHHGLANGVMIEHALAHNVAAVPERFASLAEAAGLADRSGAAFLAWLIALKAEIGIPAGLASAKVDRALIDRLVDLAVQDGCHQSNPRACSRDDFRAIFTAAYAK